MCNQYVASTHPVCNLFLRQNTPLKSIIDNMLKLEFLFDTQEVVGPSPIPPSMYNPLQSNQLQGFLYLGLKEFFAKNRLERKYRRWICCLRHTVSGDKFMKNKRRNHTAQFKAKGDKTIAALASEYEVHPKQITQWKKQLFESLPEIFPRTPAPVKMNGQELTSSANTLKKTARFTPSRYKSHRSRLTPIITL